ncbi:XTP/dITP diphosphohydrolase [Cerasibacillus quisquiliarum]|uniref:dITP/XTP pyrophosphatase n=1 Tax=Cerasibacillus quisquiliarum TaxID=227865 RepID=A0A511V0B1_9BACI|nr:XTP/dITP diphosphatase [Cerasibacillus quisquiliarum]MBB5145657.1 XTP/dITP diphosphohydrolase [Cerasibacillus quisquiliarum]GEN31451.1 non-canonical purine NTP pyrophosphatase [Cerasibacillus quisquiliarum]
MEKIIVATKNKGKAEEFKAFFSKYDIETISLLDLPDDIPDVVETGMTFQENAILKAETMANYLGQTVLADDSGLVIDALGGKPGVYSARYAGEPTNDKKNIAKVLQELAFVPDKQRTARFVCVLAVATPGKETVTRTGYCNGVISEEMKGSNGFGYDPIFIPENKNITMAQLSSEEKNEISHRRQAIIKLEDWLKNNL